MKKKFIVSLVMGFMLINTSVGVKANEIGETNQNIYNSEKQLDPEISKRIDERMEEYNNKYSKQLIDIEKVNLLLEDKESLTDFERKEAEVELLKLEEAFKSEEVNTLDLGGGPPTGSNNISFSNFSNGDIILLHDGFCSYGFWRHAGVYDSATGDFISATPASGMVRQSKTKMRGYDEALGVCPENFRNGSVNAKNVAKSLLDKKVPYSIKNASKNNNNYMYCSLVAWRAWKSSQNLDLDFDGGPTVIPTDLSHEYNTSGTKIIRRFVWSD
ncbi:hypothetical protein G6Z12_13575 [Clostridium perfringens]|uniref:Uncharacterized distant relative of cell wall-associated hydrolases n=5 Tax=Clostridium perfringens TaxID=1502 RepID=A0A2X3AEI2_CLOPF|nr:hypothetical protein [Clostridium perfringens]MDY2640765.1 hypothetical protein [Ligilactobacillus salivarius]ELC8423359.1 hypothetical protein [Clostridium perfringens]MBI6069338.1 hypothetical protein [Clostridium perfringens]MBI6097547.1 hypothetical protein [Clostridium perfringens]MCI5750832.1 hypothetical protein [Clostridium perfringens]